MSSALLRSSSQVIVKQFLKPTPVISASALRLLSTQTNNSSSNSNNNNNQKEEKTRFNSNSNYSVPLTALFLGAVGAAGIALSSTDNKIATPSKVDYNKVRESIAKLLDAPDYDDGSRGPLFVRLAWHASGTYSKLDSTGGSNGGCMRFEPESKWGANNGLQLARDLLEPIYKANPGLTYADLYTLAGVVAIEEMGGPKINWRPGRTDHKDGKKSPADGRLPDAAQGADHIRDIFYRMGFNDREIVALIGAHALGRCHTDRSGYDGPWTNAPTTFSNEYFRLLLDDTWTERRWKGPKQYENSKSGSNLMMLPADLALVKDPSFRKYVELYKNDERTFFYDFAAAFGRLLELGVTFQATDNNLTPGKPPAHGQIEKKAWWKFW